MDTLGGKVALEGCGRYVLMGKWFNWEGVHPYMDEKHGNGTQNTIFACFRTLVRRRARRMCPDRCGMYVSV